MHSVVLQLRNDFDEWRGRARGLLRAGIAPDNVSWRDPSTEAGLFAEVESTPLGERPVGSVPPMFIELAETAINNSSAERFDLLYRLLWRLQDDRTLMDVSSDPDVIRLTRMASAVRRDSHKMKAFVRFKSIADDGGQERFAAWFEPDHFTLEMTAPFFARRFAGMVWAIVTPYASAFWDGEALSFAPGGRKSDVPQDDAVEGDWKTYFASIFNPARLKIAMMKSEMPVKYWRNLPEAELITPLIRGARAAEREMIAQAATQPPSRHLRQQARQDAPVAVSEIDSLAAARLAVQDCRRCGLCEHATRAVFGAGPDRAAVMFVGEQPGDHEDLSGQPFVGPAGQVLDAALAKVGVDRNASYVTNAVKHFKFEPRGKRRIHQRPDGGEIQACKYWLNLEIKLVAPTLIVALGATAAESLLGGNPRISDLRGRGIELDDGATVFITNHPSYLLRIPDAGKRAEEQEKFEADLGQVAAIAKQLVRVS
ncbi:DNA polymerase [Devosia epidermidihirudinis]|uniref:Type-4 uracil-DNA glycosylase n=1 Tax=Devosia epidermidihirudinis TaxID=1293439 RepID=A0A0F5QIQ7_9HYPH|nr:UdgX family uracil-DNA binding protein [Devosia epidermidihirudinis]KKC40882.1 DNA polymerase [Devosia epidermidihirudinis]